MSSIIAASIPDFYSQQHVLIMKAPGARQQSNWAVLKPEKKKRVQLKQNAAITKISCLFSEDKTIPNSNIPGQLGRRCCFHRSSRPSKLIRNLPALDSNYKEWPRALFLPAELQICHCPYRVCISKKGEKRRSLMIQSFLFIIGGRGNGFPFKENT